MSSSQPCANATCDLGAAARCGCPAAPAPPPSGAVDKAAVAASGTALTACVACCTLPFALPAVALASIGPLLLWLEESQAWMTPLALAVVLGAWLWTAGRSLRSGLRPARSTLAMLGLATALLLLALAWPWIEPPWLAFLQRLS